MLNNIITRVNVRWRLMGFVIFLLLMMSAAGTGGILGMRGIKQSMSRVYEKYVQPMDHLRKINEVFRFDVTGTAERLIYEQITWDGAQEIILQAEKKLKEQFVLLERNSRDFSHENIEEKLGQDAVLLDDLLKDIKEMNVILQERDKEKMYVFFKNDLKPFQESIEKRINFMILARVEAVEREYNISEERYRTSTLAFLLTIVVGVSIGLLAGYVLMRSIDLPLAKMTNAMRDMTKGNLKARIKYESTDELGDLVKGFNKLQDYITDLVSQIQTAGIQVASSITEIAASTKEQETTSNEHAATANEIAASTSQIAATSENLLNTMKMVNRLTDTTARAAGEGHSGLSDIDATMVKMEDSAGSIVAKLSVLSEKAGDIASVVKTINKVADQTNILSLNAAIEAEKAGEYGTGFAVVATEIRRLADQTAVATYEIEQMVQGVQSAVSTAVMGIDKFAEDVRLSVREIRNGSQKMEDVIQNVEVLTPKVALISEGIEAQSLGARQISDATSQLNETAQHSAESIAQIGSIILQLQKATQGLQKAITRFRIDEMYTE